MFTLCSRAVLLTGSLFHLTCFSDNGEEKKPENLRPNLHKEISVLNTAFKVN